MAIEPADERILRAKYLDWCSARVADRFLELTPDQIYDLAHHPPVGTAGHVAGAPARSAPAVSVTAGIDPPDPPGGPAASVPRRDASPNAAVSAAGDAPVLDLSYPALVARVTEALAVRLELPSFTEWVAQYEKAPEQFEEELLGLWQRKV